MAGSDEKRDLNEPPPPPPPKTEDQKSDGDESTPKASDGWYYASEGEKHGPVEPPELIGLLANGVIGRDTIVWQHGMSDWIPLDQTEVWASISENQTKLLASISEGDSPPPLPPAYVSDKLAWIIAFVPLIIPFIERIPTDTPFLMYFVFLFFVSGLTFFDAKQIAKSGHNTEKLKQKSWLSLLPPVYLFRRAKAFGQPLDYFWTSIVATFITIFIVITSHFSSTESQSSPPTRSPSHITDVTPRKFSCSNEEVIGTLKQYLLTFWIIKDYVLPEMVTFINQEKYKSWGSAYDSNQTHTMKEVAQAIRAYVTEEIMNNTHFDHVRTLEEGPRNLSCEVTWEDMDTSAMDNAVIFTSPSTGKPVTGREYARGASQGHIQSAKDLYNPIKYQVVLYDDGVTYAVKVVGELGKTLDRLPPMPDEIRQEWFDGK